MFAFVHSQHQKATAELQADEPAGAMVHDLGSSDRVVRQNARRALVQMGGNALPALKNALADPHVTVRWEAATALGELCDQGACEPLAHLLGDTDGNVRWAAAESLMRMGRLALPGLFKALMEHSDSRNLRECAHSVLVSQNRGDLKPILEPVIAALEGVAPSAEVPHTAHAALHALRGEADHRRAG